MFINNELSCWTCCCKSNSSDERLDITKSQHCSCTRPVRSYSIRWKHRPWTACVAKQTEKQNSHRNSSHHRGGVGTLMALFSRSKVQGARELLSLGGRLANGDRATHSRTNGFELLYRKGNLQLRQKLRMGRRVSRTIRREMSPAQWTGVDFTPYEYCRYTVSCFIFRMHCSVTGVSVSKTDHLSHVHVISGVCTRSS